MASLYIYIYIYSFGTTHLSFYKPDSRLPSRFRYFDMISASQYFHFSEWIMLHSPMSKTVGSSG